MKERKTRAGALPVSLLMGLSLIAGLFIAGWLLYLRPKIRENNEMNAARSLKILTVAEVDFRANDRDGNRVNDFWTGDVAGLYYLPDPSVPGSTIKLIEPGHASADPNSITRPGPAVPFHGYWFVAVPMDETGTPYRMNIDNSGKPSMNNRNTSKFGFCAYPADYPRSGRWTYIVNEGNTIFKIDAGGKPVLRFPADPKLKNDYSGGPDS